MHDTAVPGKTANVGAYGVHENVQYGDFVTENEERDLKRGLAQRHISMIALAGLKITRHTFQFSPH
jgi:amino acid transporter